MITADRPLLIHAGLPKTGTTLLQQRLFAQHPDVEYLGIYKGHPGATVFDRCRDSLIGGLFRRLMLERRPRIDEARRLFVEQIQPGLAANRTPVWSWETFSCCRPGVRRRRARHLCSVFGACRVLVTLRHPVEIIESAYLLSLIQFVRTAAAAEGPGATRRRWSIWRWRSALPPDRTIESWLAAHWRRTRLRFYLDYARTVEIFGHELGRDRVHVAFFEELKHDRERYVRSLCEACEIDGDEAVRLIGTHRENDRWGQETIDRLQQILNSPARLQTFLDAPLPERFEMIGLGRDGTPRPEMNRARCVIPDGWRRRIEDETRIPNRRLQREWGLSVSEFGYPV